MDRSHFLVETDWLEEHLYDPHIRIVDMRGYVRTVESNGVQEALYVGAREEYEQGHIPGAIYIDWSSDIVDPDESIEAQIAPPERFAAVLSSVGIGDQHQIVVHDSHPASQFATRFWWACSYYGHNQIVVLNGGFNKWEGEGKEIEHAIPSYPEAIFTPTIQPKLRTTAYEIMQNLDSHGMKLLDARERKQFTGEIVRGHGRPGHIPGAINIPREALIDSATGTFKSSEELQKIFLHAGVRPDERQVAYCNGGVAATTLLFGLAMLGYPELTNYDGSWNEWGIRQNLPVEISDNSLSS